MLTVLTTKRTVFLSFHLLPADAKTSSPWDPWQIQTSVCMSICVCLQGENKKKPQCGGGTGRRGEGLLGSAFFLHTALTKASLFFWPVTRGDALMIARCLSHGSCLNLNSREKLQSWLVMFTSAFPLGASQINPCVSDKPGWCNAAKKEGLWVCLVDFLCNNIMFLNVTRKKNSHVTRHNLVTWLL